MTSTSSAVSEKQTSALNPPPPPMGNSTSADSNNADSRSKGRSELPASIKPIERGSGGASAKFPGHPTEPTRSSGYGAMLIFTIILAAATGLLGFEIGKRHGTVTVNNSGSSGSSVGQLPNQVSDQTGQGGRTDSGSSPSASTGQVASGSGAGNSANQGGTSQTTNPVSNQPGVLGAVTSQTYTNSAMHFSMQIPGDWKITSEPNEILFTAPDRSVYSVQVYDVTPATDLNFIESQLVQQSNVHNVNAVTFAGIPALSFDIDGNFGNGYTFVQNGKLFYLLGVDVGSKVQNFQII